MILNVGKKISFVGTVQFWDHSAKLWVGFIFYVGSLIPCHLHKEIVYDSRFECWYLESLYLTVNTAMVPALKRENISDLNWSDSSFTSTTSESHSHSDAEPPRKRQAFSWKLLQSFNSLIDVRKFIRVKKE